MNNDDSVNDVESETTSNAPPTDTSGKPVDVSDAEDVDQTNTPSSTRTKEEEAEELSRKIAEIERKVADGN
jgi:anti-sigma28 factor (negative regulator of flagellin synthesis)